MVLLEVLNYEWLPFNVICFVYVLYLFIFPQRALLQILQGPPSPHIYEVALLTAPLDHMNRQNNYELVSPRIMNFSQEKAW